MWNVWYGMHQHIAWAPSGMDQLHGFNTFTDMEIVIQMLENNGCPYL